MLRPYKTKKWHERASFVTAPDDEIGLSFVHYACGSKKWLCRNCKLEIMRRKRRIIIWHPDFCL